MHYRLEELVLFYETLSYIHVYLFVFSGFRCKMYLLLWVMVRKVQKSLPCTMSK